jgi:hypothetical protein
VRDGVLETLAGEAVDTVALSPYAVQVLRHRPAHTTDSSTDERQP